MKKLLTVAGLTLLALAGCQSGDTTTNVNPAEGQVNEVIVPPVEVTLPDAESATEAAPVVDDSAATTTTTEVNY